MMQKIATLLIIISFFIAGCVKNKNTACGFVESSLIAPTSEVDSLKTLLKDSAIIAMPNAIGFFYSVQQSGSGTAIVNLCSTVSVSYVGKLFNGTVFDSTANNQLASFQLGQVIAGWQKGLPLITKGGKITLYVPPTLGYGSNSVIDRNGNIVIPGNSYLIFHIYLVDIQ